MTQQEIFETVVKHLAAQKRQSHDGHQCRYHWVDQNGCVLKCAAGCLIGDEDYNPIIEGTSFGTDGEGYISRATNTMIALRKKLGLNDSSSYDLIRKLQEAHDNSSSLEELHGNLCKVGERHNINNVDALVGLITEWEVAENN